MLTLSQNRNIFYGLVGLLIVVYVYLSFNAPDQPNANPEFVLTGITKLIIQITFTLPIVFSWFFGATTFWRGWSFARISRDESLSKVFKYLSLGLGILLLGFIMGSIIGQVRTYNPGDADIARAVTIAVNYIYVVSQLLGFWFLYKGASAGNKGRFLGSDNKDAVVAGILAFIIGLFWVGLIFTNPTRQISEDPGIAPSFYINDLLIIFTIILPTLLGWFFGIIASFRLGDLAVTAAAAAAAAAADTPLQKIFSKLVSGVSFLILGFIVLLGILSAGGERLLSLGLVGVLVLVYVLVLLLLLAYWRTAGALKALYKNPQLVTHEHSQ